MSRIQNYRDLEVWQRGVQLILIAYDMARRFPTSEQFELSRQIRRAATSIPANIAEGHERRGKGYLHHVRIALGSLAELETHMEVAHRLGYMGEQDMAVFSRDADPLRRMLHGLRRSLMRQLVSRAVPPTGGLSLVLALSYI